MFRHQGRYTAGRPNNGKDKHLGNSIQRRFGVCFGPMEALRDIGWLFFVKKVEGKKGRREIHIENEKAAAAASAATTIELKSIDICMLYLCSDLDELLEVCEFGLDLYVSGSRS